MQMELSLLQNGFSLMTLIKRNPIFTRVRKRRSLEFYLSERGLGFHYGVFRSFEEARQWLPPSKEFGHEEFMDEYIEVRSKRIFSFDYPVIFWLRDIFSSGAKSIYDLGGSVGVHYYSYQRYLQYPDELHWRVQELPASVKKGREIAIKRGVTQLSFTDDLDITSNRSDVWMAAGAIEFIENQQLDTLLEKTEHRPSHILLNKVPMYDGEDYVSTQNIGKMSFVPHYVYNFDKYIGRIDRLGYELIDCWDVPDRNFSFPGVPERCFSPYRGLYFRQRASAR